MNYFYITAYQLTGLNYSELKNSIIYSDNEIHAYVSDKNDQHINELDFGFSLMYLNLKNLINDELTEDDINEIKNQVLINQNERYKGQENRAILVILFQGELSDDSINVIKLFEEGYGFCDFELSDIDIDKTSRDAILFSIILSTPQDMKIKTVKEGIYLKDNDENIYYSFDIKPGTASFQNVKSIDRQIIDEAAKQIKIIQSDDTLLRIIRLYNDSINVNSSRIKSFTFIYAALEIFIDKLLKRIKKDFFKDLKTDNEELNITLDLIDSLASSRFGQKSKFHLLSYMISRESMIEDLKKFETIKRARTDFYHRAKITEDDLPLEEAQELFKKYVLNYLNYLKK